MACQDSTAYPPIEDYAVIGDCRSAALVSRGGSLDWLCLPRFDSPSVFAAILDAERGGRFVVRPVGPFRAARRYLPDTVILETTFRTETGVLRLLDLMPVASEKQKRTELTAEHEILRAIECLEGEVPIEVICDPRFDYGRFQPRARFRGKLGLFYEYGAHLLALRSDLALEISGDQGQAVCRATLRAGELRFVSLVDTIAEPATLPPLGGHARGRIDTSIQWWKEWAGRCGYRGPYRDAVVRSALTLKLMTYAPSGAVIAAPTTSLPERIGGERNWDYRYCWLRDASLTLRSLLDLGYTTEGKAFLSWLLHSTRLTRPKLQIVYDVFGETRLTERQLTHLEGYRKSRPVRVGNAAQEQLQLDVYGEVVHAVQEFIDRGGVLDRPTQRLLVGMGKAVCRHWREPDEGIWEIRSSPRHHTYSKVMCWVALDALVRMQEAGHLRVPASFRTEREKLRAEIEAHGYNEELGSYVSTFDGTRADANLLLLGRYGYQNADHPRMQGTWNKVKAELEENGLLYRSRDEDGLPAGEGAFGICSFWAVGHLARQGSLGEAVSRFEHLLTFANDLGLYAEEIDPRSGAALGNFPQSFTHVGLIDAALMLEARREGTESPPGTSIRRDALAQGGKE